MATAQLAIDGGQPVSTGSLPPRFIGANLIGREERKLVCEAIDKQCLFRHYGAGMPHFVNDLEQEFRDFIGMRYALAVATGSGAYFCAMKALGIGPGDEVIIPAFGWITDHAMVEFAGAVPVIAAVDESMNLNPEDFKAKITPKTKAVVIVYYQGAASRTDEIVAIAKAHKIKVLEDVAQACGGSFNGRRLGAWGDIACYSLQNNKVITSGDGGMLITNDQELYEKAVRFHDLGMIRDTFVKNLAGPIISGPSSGMQWRMNEMAGAVGLAQLRKLPLIIENCRKYSLRYKNALRKEFPGLKFRMVKDEDDMGIVVIFDLHREANVAYFEKAFTAEGLLYGPTSGCKTLNELDSVRVPLERNGRYDQKVFVQSHAIDARTAKIAILPVYRGKDIKNLITGTVKILKAMRASGRIKL